MGVGERGMIIVVAVHLLGCPDGGTAGHADGAHDPGIAESGGVPGETAEDGNNDPGAGVEAGVLEKLLPVCAKAAECTGVPFGSCSVSFEGGCKDLDGFLNCAMACATKPCSEFVSCEERCHQDACG